MEAGEIDNSILDLNTEDLPTGTTGYTSLTGVSALAGLSPLQPASSVGLQFVQPTIPQPRFAAFLTVLVSTTSSSVFFKMPSVSQEPLFLQLWIYTANGLSRRNQIQHTEWSLSPQIFK